MGRLGVTVIQINDLLYLLFCSVGTNQSKKIKRYLIESMQMCLQRPLWSWFICDFSVFLPSLSLFSANVKHNIECEIFMRFPFMSAHPDPFIIYLAIKRICPANQFIVSTSFCYTATNFPGFKNDVSPVIIREPQHLRIQNT